MRTRTDRVPRVGAHQAPKWRPRVGPRKPRATPTGPLVACTGCGTGKRKPLLTRHAATIFTKLGERRIERGQPVCVWCLVQVESFGRTRLEEPAE